jgi:CHASE3 domain sensor protein
MPTLRRRIHRIPTLDVLIVLVMLGLCIAAGVLLLQVRVQASTAESVTHTREVLQRVGRANLSIAQAEGSGRGFLLTGDPLLAQRYEAARQMNQQQLKELVLLTRDNPTQQAVLAHLASETDRRLEILHASIERRRGGMLNDPEMLRDGVASMARLAGYAAQLEAEEERLLAERRASALAARHGVAVSAGTIVALCLTLALVLLLRAAVGRSRDAVIGWSNSGQPSSLEPSRL